MKKIFSDWKLYVMIASMVMIVFVDLVSEDYVSAIWVVLAFALWCQNYELIETLKTSRELLDKQKDLIIESDVIMNLQASMIKDLNNKLDEQTKSNENGVRDTELDQSGERSEKNMG